jgi:hypothetical protein
MHLSVCSVSVCFGVVFGIRPGSATLNNAFYTVKYLDTDMKSINLNIHCAKVHLG